VSPEVAAAVIAGVASLVAGVVTGYSAPVLKAKRERRLEVEEIHARYRDALLRAAYGLQSRLWNILAGISRYYPGRGSADRYVQDSTLWLIGQYFGWVEAMRRDAQFLDIGSVGSARKLESVLGRVEEGFFSDQETEDNHLIIFRVDQQAIGELMIDEKASRGGRTRCIGYTDFKHRLNDCAFYQRLAPLREDLEAVVPIRRKEGKRQPGRGAPGERIQLIQHRLIELIDLLDPKLHRFPDHRDRFPPADSQPELGARSAGQPAEDR
jgi:hypothetical protein